MYFITLQYAVPQNDLPSTAQFKKWAKASLQKKVPAAELTIRIVDKNEITALNATYRNKNKPTNVLSFPFDMPPGIELDVPLLGDIIICKEVIEEEAQMQEKPVLAHWAHMVVHGVLHLLGYDHELDDDAEKMEAEEIIILKQLGFENPYKTSYPIKGET